MKCEFKEWGVVDAAPGATDDQKEEWAAMVSAHEEKCKTVSNLSNEELANIMAFKAHNIKTYVFPYVFQEVAKRLRGEKK